MSNKYTVLLKSIEKKSIKLGAMLIQAKLINEEQLQSALRRQFQKSLKYELTTYDTLVKLGFLKKELLNKILELCNQKKKKIGQYLVSKSLISNGQLDRALEAQKKSGLMIGEHLISFGYISEGLFYNLLKKNVSSIEITNLLLEKKIIDQEQLEKAKKVNRIGYRLGETLIDNGIINEDQFKKFLSLQYGIPFQRLDKFIIIESDKKILSNLISMEMSRTYNVVPYRLNQDKVELAAGDVNFLEDIKELEKTSGYSFYICLVTDSDVKMFHGDLYSKINAQPQADQIMKKVAFESNNKKHPKEQIPDEGYSSGFIQSHVLFLREYFNSLINSGFSEKQALKILGEEAIIKYPGRPSIINKTANVAEIFSISFSGSENKDEIINKLFQNYLKAKVSCGEEINKMKLEAFEKIIVQNCSKIKKIKNCESTKCSIIIKNGFTKILLIEN